MVRRGIGPWLVLAAFVMCGNLVMLSGRGKPAIMIVNARRLPGTAATRGVWTTAGSGGSSRHVVAVTSSQPSTHRRRRGGFLMSPVELSRCRRLSVGGRRAVAVRSGAGSGAPRDLRAGCGRTGPAPRSRPRLPCDRYTSASAATAHSEYGSRSRIRCAQSHCWGRSSPAMPATCSRLVPLRRSRRSWTRFTLSSTSAGCAVLAFVISAALRARAGCPGPGSRPLTSSGRPACGKVCPAVATGGSMQSRRKRFYRDRVSW